jgi:glutathione S-transferase
MLDKHLSDGRFWLLGGSEPTFSDTTLCVAIAMGKFKLMHTDLTHRFEFIDKYWQRWQERESFKVSNMYASSYAMKADRGS